MRNHLLPVLGILLLAPALIACGQQDTPSSDTPANETPASEAPAKSAAESRREQGEAALLRGELGQARDLLDDAVAAAGDAPAALAPALTARAAVLRRHGELAAALDDVERALGLLDAESADELAVLAARVERARLHFETGQLEAARESLEAARQRAAELSDAPLLTAANVALVEVLAAQGDFVEARKLNFSMRVIRLRTGQEAKAAECFQRIVDFMLVQGATEPAVTTAEKAVETWQGLDLPRRRAEAELALARALVAAGRIDEAARAFEAPATVLQDSPDPRLQGEVIALRARLAAAAGRLETDDLRDAIAAAEAAGRMAEAFERRLDLVEVERAAGAKAAQERAESLATEARTAGFEGVALRVEGKVQPEGSGAGPADQPRA